MKRQAFRKTVLIIGLLGTIIFAGCSNLFDAPVKPEPGISPETAATGRVSISLEGTGTDEAGRTLFPHAPVFSKYDLIFTPLDGQTATAPVTITDGARYSLDLAGGYWTIAAVGYVHIQGVSGITDGDYEAARGEATNIYVSTYSAQQISIDINGGVQPGQQGIFSYTVTLPTGFSAAFLQILPLTGGTALKEVSLLSSNPSGSFALDAGYYFLKIKYTKDGKETIRTEVIHIYGGLTTAAAGTKYDFTGFSSIADLMYYLASAAVNTASNPYTIVLKGINLEQDLYKDYDPLRLLFEALSGKYVRLDLSACTGFNIPYSSIEYRPNKDKIVSLILPDTITNIGEYMFRDCTALESVDLPDHLTTIKNHAFYNNSSLTSIIFPDSLVSIGNEAFRGCNGITFQTTGNNVHVSTLESGKVLICNGVILEWLADKTGAITIPEGITDIGTVFQGSGITSIDMPNSLNAIGDYAFRGCTSLTSIDLPDSLTTIGEGAFIGCTLLAAIDLYSTQLTSIGGYAFSGDDAFNGCTSLTSIDLPDSLTTIGRYAFAFSSLTSIGLPDSLTTIGEGAFFACASITAVNLSGTQVTSIDEYTFQGCTSLAAIDLSSIQLTSISGYAFNSCTSLTTIDLAGTQITSISGYAFNGCTSLAAINLSGTQVTSISSSAFSGCTALASVDLPYTLTTIGDDAFKGCNNITFHITGSGQFSTGGNGKLLIKNGVTLIAARTGGDITIPAGITDIGTVFRSSQITSIILPASLTSIGNEAFKGCSLLESISLPNTLTSIGNETFKGCSLLESISLPDTLTSIGEQAFGDCTSLEEIDLSMCISLTVLSKYIFIDCHALTSIKLPNSLTIINDGAFSGCHLLARFDFPYSLNSMGYNIFYSYYDPPALTTLIVRAVNPPAWDGSMYRSSIIIYVPDASVDAYQGASNWSAYASKIKPINELP
ncbi:surface antigen BspA [Treponema primitia ZAS-2]|uniref:Surface antigen BspA n=1 Tax=Treponema primitia (strain ATCC BAA-887 / DSM 12427 / ZAS-2) TaxID=545694 RepID=F5YHD0_TREPZ|nr:leucine-rich repeat domain-containing protein [Treponema primitia]AEF84138.1 surface antigen BspA [Treponema primitia ZAS-2]